MKTLNGLPTKEFERKRVGLRQPGWLPERPLSISNHIAIGSKIEQRDTVAVELLLSDELITSSSGSAGTVPLA